MIPEIQRYKEKFPAYKNIPDSELLKLVVKKYPVYQDLLDKHEKSESFGNQYMSALKETAGDWGAAAKQAISPKGIAQMINPALGVLPEEAHKPLAQEFAKTMARPMGGMQAMVSGEGVETGDSLLKGAAKSFKQGWKEPFKQPTMGESTLKAYEKPIQDIAKVLFAVQSKDRAKKDMMEFLNIKEPEIQGIIAGTVGTIAEVGSLHLLYTSLPRAAAGITKATTGIYTRAQGVALEKLTKQVAKELEPTMGKVNAEMFAKVKVYQHYLKTKTMKRTPWAIDKSVKALEANEGIITRSAAKIKAAQETAAGVKTAQEAAKYKPGSNISNIEKIVKPLQLTTQGGEKLGIPNLTAGKLPLQAPKAPLVKPEVPQTFTKPSGKDILEYLAHYLPGKEVAKLSGAERLKLANDAIALKKYTLSINQKVASKPEIKAAVTEKAARGDAGFIKIAGDLKGLEEVKKKLVAKLSVKGSFEQEGFPESGKQVRNFLSKTMAGEEKTLVDIGKLTKFPLDKGDYNLLAYSTQYKDIKGFKGASLNPEEKLRISQGHKYIREWFDNYFKKLPKDQFDLPFPQSRMRALREELGHILASSKGAKGKASQLRSLAKRKREIETELDFYVKNKIQYVHLPVRLWLADKFNKDPVGYHQIIKGTFKQIADRQTPTIEDLVDMGLIKAEDVDIRDIMSSYGRYVNRELAYKDIVEMGKKEGAILPKGAKGTEGFVDLPIRYAPILKGFVAHPGYANALESYFKGFEAEQGSASRILSAIKMAQFYNPLYMAKNDLDQLAMLGGLVNIKAPIYMVQAIRDVVKKTDLYWEAYHNGAFSVPYQNPYNSYVKMVEGLKKSMDNRGSLILDALSKSKEYITKPWKVIPDLYNVIHATTWNLDHVMRMSGVHYLIDKGYPVADAADMAAKYFADYADVPPATRRLLNKILFTPTYEIAMNKLYIEGFKNFSKGKRKLPYSKLLLMMAGLVIGKDLFYTNVLGYRREDFGRRYVKDVETDTGMKEFVTVISDPSNLWLRYYHDLSPNAMDIDITDRIKRFGWYRIHPAWRNLYKVTEGKDERGDYIYNSFDPVGEQVKDRLEWLTKKTFRITEIIPQMAPKDRQETRELMVKEMGPYLTTLVNSVAFSYLREPDFVRFGRKANMLEGVFNKQFKQALETESLDEFDRKLEPRMNRYIQKLEKGLEEYLGEE